MTIKLGRHHLTIRRGITWFLIMLGALVAFELFNFSTTEYALASLFGPHDALGLASWATVLSIAFCGIDFAGLSRLFTPAADWRREPREIWFLTLAWLLGAGMNAVMTWWAVATALTENPALGNELVSRQQIMQYVPLFVALLVWMTRIMLIGSLATLGDRLFQRANQRTTLPGNPQHTPRSEPRSTPVRKTQPLFDQRRQPRPVTAQASNSRASSVRSYPRREAQPQPAASHSGMPIGAYGHRMATGETTYVDLD